jgi:Holliday junction resolvase RusA-like endonuclease
MVYKRLVRLLRKLGLKMEYEDYQIHFITSANPIARENDIQIDWHPDRNPPEMLEELLQSPYYLGHTIELDGTYCFFYASPRRVMVFEIFGKPQSKARHRTMVKNGKVISYTPKKTRESTEFIRDVIDRNKPEKPIDEPIALTIKFYMPIPKSWSKKKKEQALKREIYPTGKPDIDNLIKLIKDSFNQIVWRDDSLVVKYNSIEKLYSETPRTVVIVEKINWRKENDNQDNNKNK